MGEKAPHMSVSQQSNEFAYISQIDENSDVSVAPKIVRDMRIMLHKPTIQQKGLVAIWALGLKTENREFLTSSGAGQIVVDVMRTYPEDKRLLKLSCGAIKNLGGNLNALYRMGVGSEIMNCMKRFPGEMDLQQQACSAIKNLGKSKSNSEKLVEDGVADLILTAMRNHGSSVDTLKTACGALWCLCTATDSKEILWGCGVGRALVEAMSKFPDHERLQENACGALWTLGYHYSMMRIGAAEAVLFAMQRFESSQTIMIYGSFVIKNLGSVKTNALQLVDIGAAETLMSGIKTQKGKPAVEENGCLALWALSLWADTKLTLIERGIADFLLEVMKSSGGNPRVFCGAVSVMTNLATIDSPLLDHAEIGGMLRWGLGKHSGDEVAVEKSLFCLRNLFFWDAQGLRDLNVERAVNEAMSRYAHNSTIRKKGEEIIAKLREP